MVHLIFQKIRDTICYSRINNRTSAPELAVSIISSIKGSNELAVGNVLGSNLFNTLMVLGVTTIIMPLTIKKSEVKRDFAINMIVTILFLILTFTKILGGKDNFISRGDGIILLVSGGIDG